MRWRLLLIGTLALAQRELREPGRRQGRNAYKTRRNRRLDGTRRRRWGTTEPLTGPHVCGNGDRRYCCAGWRQHKGSSECNIPICAPNACGDGICHSPGMCRCADGKLRKRCNEDEFFETEARCSSPCQNGGRCINGECECPEGFTGAHCGQPICGASTNGVSGCRNGGRCIGVDKCACVYGFYGDNCEVDYRRGPCFGKIDKAKNECSSQVLSEYSTKEQCCATVGQAWGDPCEECPARPGNCGRGYDSNCNNINECIDINGICKGCKCRDTIGSFVCIAPEGFYFDEDKNECLDLDECADSPCGSDNECTNLPGGYSCDCAEGYIKTVDQDGKQTCIDNRPGTCFEHVSNSVCTDPLSKMLTKTQCCCLGNFASSPGQCFQGQESSGIDNCPTVGTEAYSMLCDNAETIDPKNLGPDGSGPDPITDICESKGLCEKGVCITDEKGIPMCLCDNGYEPETVDLQCRDINECETGEGQCDNGRCVNTDGGWYCECDAGYVPSGNGQECENIDECAEGLAQCANGKCIDRDGTWACACDEGFQPDPLQRNQKCIDIDECNIGGNKCANGVCSNVIGDYQCVCEVGYERGPDRKSCHDIDECANDHACINGECKNTPGSYRCACNKGYKYNPEQGICENIDECEFNPCQGGTCTDTDGDFKCECGKYQMLDATGRRCVDQPNGQCFRSSNKNGRKCAADSMLPNQMSRQDCCCHAAELDRTSSFRLNNKCDVCPAVGTSNFNELCKGSEKPDSYCDLELNPCGNNGQCYDVDGGYECQCDEGYELHPSGTLCIDTPECDTKCLNGLCTELDGSFECVCPSGHHFNDKTGSCDDDDECLERPCSGGQCINAPGGFECVCAPGLVLDSTGLICLDKREEACWLEHEDDTCVDNIPGRYTAELCCATQGKAWGDECVDCSEIPLTCRKGYVFDRVADRCVEVDECQLFPQYCSGNGAKCVNTDGSFYCECPNGLTLDDSGRRCIDTRKSVCFPNFNATHPFCHDAWEGLHSRQTCCCSIAGEAWGEGNECRACPREGTPEYDELCPCADGNCYNPNPNDRENCKQINNCLEFPEICGEFGECKFNPEDPSDLCQCAPGFGTTDKGFPCVDIDECALLGDDACGEGECVNTPGSFKCKCKPGYVLGNDGVCVNDNECLNNVCLGGGNCTDTEGSFECSCPPNTHLADDGVTCVDDNECDLQIEPCINGRCINLIGDWKCQCHSGYKPTPDNKGCVNTNECLDDNGGCEQRCTDTEGSFICSCRDGFELSPNGFDCIDVDECSEEPAICGGGKCENLEGSYTCHCIPGYELVSNRQLCIDVNECDINPDICVHGKCTNTEGSYTCDCWDGFCISPDLSRCDDENECELGTHICSPNAECNNNVGTYQCHCQTGFDGDGVDCSDVDECEADTHGCHPNADCINIPGGYNCECHPGYVGNGTECADVMDCDQDPNICGPHGVCVNSPGDYNCECEFGYTPSYNGKRCEDINECKGDKPVCRNGNCVNMDGTYACECHEGYELNDEGDQCVDINECRSETEDTSICLGGKCRNTIGSFTCECPPNYTYIPGGSGCVDLRQGNCYAEVEYGTCSDLIGPNTRRAECCCSGAGFGWAEVEDTIESTCEVCPAIGSAEHLQLCPFGPGFEPDSIRLIPKDINECSAMAGACKGGNCRNLDGSYDCNCPDGYELDNTGRNCVDINECESEENPCGPGQCINQLGHHQCVCEDGYIPSEDGRACEDIRMGECFKSYNPFMNPSCDNAFSFKATKKACCCANDLGKAWGDSCEECPQGDDRIAFCKDAKSACDQIPDLCRDGYCIEDPGHDIKCECRPGMTLKPGSYECIDNDECADPNTKCPQFSHCVNKKGSYDCICDDGFTERNGVCVNIDECSMIEGTCANGKCTDTVGGFHCECDNGYEPENDNKSCVNIDECNDYPNICGSPGAVKHCIDLEGSHRCVCNPGYEFDREDQVCVNINECERFAGHDNICQNGDCVDIVGGFMCDCDDGFQVSDDSRTCVDVDECEEYGNPCVSGECINLNGNYTCQCDPGYTFNGESCVNINECQTVPGLCSHGHCEDLEGGFQCHCPHGYTQTSDGTDCFDERQGKCFVGSRSCNNDALGQLLTQSQCCCMCNGDNSWSYRGGCGKCPTEGSEAFNQMCPEGCGMSTGPDGHPIDINECDLIDTACTNGTCVNTDSSYKCDCGKGYHLDADGTTCVDTDECSALVNPCGRGECFNDEGGFTCECDDGYAPTGPNGSCQDIDECATGAHQCAYRCKNETPQNGKYSCLCPSGYELKPDGRHCKDINECAQNPDPCALKGQVCKNFVGYYVCQCPNGMRRNPVTDQCQDIDECAENADLCDNGTCINKPNGGGYWCKCKPGFVANNDMTKCDDSREFMCYTTKVSGMCLQTSATMSSAAVRFDECCCSGHGAGWGDGRTQKYNAVECRSCPDKDSAAFRELCPAGIGYDKNGNVINDCDVVPNACENGICVNNQPGFTCECDPGYTIDETGTKCIDIDECATDAHKCPSPAMCRNTDGDYDCICPEGYEMIDNVCVDLDECKTKNNNCQYICTNTIGSYECECPMGYKKHNNACVDRNECDEQFNICGPRGICVNDPGSFHCICKRGYRLNDSGDECVDLNECQSRYGCPTGCFNTPGGFRCPQQCPPGYMHFRGRCVDVNECNSSPCGAGQVCNNFRGSFQCNCRAGYRDAGQGCSDVDECQINGGTCSNGCDNEDGNYSCTCGPDSYKAGNGHCISTQRSFTQPGYHRGWNAGKPAGRGPATARVIGGERRCYGGSCHSRRHAKRYRRDVETNITTIVDSMDPQAAIIEGVPIEIDLTRADYLNEPTRFMKLLELVPSHSPLKQNVRYHVESGNGKGIFKIVQHQTHATLLVSKDKFNTLHSGSYNLVIKGISTLDDDVIGILSDNVDTIRRDLQNPLPGLEIFISVDNTSF